MDDMDVDLLKQGKRRKFPKNSCLAPKKKSTQYIQHDIMRRKNVLVFGSIRDQLGLLGFEGCNHTFKVE
jgi:hypothetical protein